MDSNHTINEAQELRNSLKMLIYSPEKVCFRKVMELSASLSDKHAFISELKSFIREEFSLELDNVLGQTMSFENTNINIDSLKFVDKSWIDSLYLQEQSQNPEKAVEGLGKASNDDKCKTEGSVQKTINFNGSVEEVKCGKAVNILKSIAELLEMQFSNIKLLEKILLPLNKKCILFDKQVNLIEYIYLKTLYKKIKGHKKGIQGMLSLVLIIGNCILSNDKNSNVDRQGASADMKMNTGKEVFFRQFSYLLNVLKSFGLKGKFLWNSKDLMIEHDYNILKKQKTDFCKVYQYFKDQEKNYSKHFHRKIEKFMLKKLYSDLDDSIIISKFVTFENNTSHNDIRYIYKIFNKTGNKKGLLGIYEKFIATACKSFTDFVKIFKINNKILQAFKDENFEKVYCLSIEKFFECLDNCQKASDFIDDVMNSHSLAVEHQVYEVFKIIVFLVEKSKTSDIFLSELEKKLSLRLFSYDKKEIEQRFVKEFEFIKLLPRAQNEKMACMISDFSKPIKEDENSVLLMRVCKWPVFKTHDVIFDNNEVSKFKRCFEDKMKRSKKKISWIDSLSFVKVELFGREIVLSLFQYDVVSKIMKEGEKCVDDVLCTSYKMSKSGFDIPKLYLNQFRSLIKTVLFEDDGYYVISQNPIQPPKSPIEFFDSSNDEFGSFSYNLKAFYEAKISKILKKEKTLLLDDLHLKLSDLNLIDKNQVREYVEGLVQKGIVEFDEKSNVVCYSI